MADPRVQRDKKAADGGTFVPLVMTAFFISGTCGLAYEVVWGRMLVLVVGGSTYATSIVLATFMAGAAIGSWVFGNLADRSRSPLGMYGWIQIGIGAFGALLPFAVGAAERGYVALAGHVSSAAGLNLVRFLFAFIVLLVPSFLMGGTFPVVSRHLARKLSTVGRVVGTAYSVNTWGGMLGSFVAGVYLLGRIGMRGTLFSAAGANVAVGVAALIASSRVRPGVVEEGRGRGPARAGRKLAARHGSRVQLLAITILAVSGFSSLAYEVFWTRLLVFVIGNSTWSFTVVLTTFLAGLAIGSLLVSRYIDRIRRPLLVLGSIEFAIGFAAILFIPVFGRLNDLQNSIAGFTRNILLFQFSVSLLAMLGPAALMGTVFPFALKLYVREARRIGGGAGRGYSVNTIGSIAGSLAAGFILIPALGLRNGIIAVAAVNVCAGAGLVALSVETALKRRCVSTCAVFALFGVVVFLLPSQVYMGGPLAKIMNRIYYDDGVGGTVEVYETRVEKIRNLIINGVPEVPTDRLSLQAFRMLGHLPLLLHERPEKVLIVTFGGGIVAGTVAEHDLKKIDCVEICPGVVRAAQLFSKENKNVLENPRVVMHIDDGRNFLLTAREQFDVITADATHPSGADSWVLYTRENYGLFRDRLTADGVLVQWLPLHGLSNRDFRVILGTFSSVFPSTSVWFVGANPDFGHAVVVGLKAGGRIPLKRVKERLELGFVRDDLEPYGLDNPYALAARLMLDSSGVAELSQGVPVNTDDLPWIAFTPQQFRERNMNVKNLTSMLDLGIEPDLFTADSAETDSMRQYAESRVHTIRGILAICERDPALAFEELNAALLLNPGEEDASYLLSSHGLKDGALAYESLRVQGMDLALKGMYAEAARSFARAARIRETMEVYNDLGMAYMKCSNYAEARKAFRKALEIDPASDVVRGNIRALERLEKSGVVR